MAGGRPPKLFTAEEVHILGQDLLQWIESEESKKTIIWVDWYWNKHQMFRSDWKSLIQRPEFLPYYELARQKMASNITFNDKIPQSYGNRYLHKYDDQLQDFEEANRDKEAARKKSSITSEAMDLAVTQMQSLLTSLRSSKRIAEDKAPEVEHS